MLGIVKVKREDFLKHGFSITRGPYYELQKYSEKDALVKLGEYLYFMVGYTSHQENIYVGNDHFTAFDYFVFRPGGIAQNAEIVAEFFSAYRQTSRYNSTVMREIVTSNIWALEAVAYDTNITAESKRVHDIYDYILKNA